jgi:hypothetical protein
MTTLIQSDGQPVSSSNPLPVTQTAPTAAASSGATSTVSFARTADTNVYAAGDVIGINAAGSPGSAIHTFTSVGPEASSVIITGADLAITLSSVTAGMTSYELHIYNESPTAILDNAAFDLVTGDIAKHRWVIPLGTVVDYGSQLFTGVANLGMEVKLATGSTSLYGELVTVGTFTPASGTTFQIRIHTLAV